jgi:predicted SAM-dependent methyltransferase
MKLDIGCGGQKKAGFIGVDILNLEGVDIVHDLTIFPYPFEDNSVDEIYMDNVLEHLPNPMKVVEEIWRISKKGTKITIAVPYFRSHYAFIDPTHMNYFGVNWFNYFDPKHLFQQKMQYSTAKLSLNSFVFDREWLYPKSHGFLHGLLIKFANKYPYKYETKISHILPLNSLTFYLSVIK